MEKQEYYYIDYSDLWKMDEVPKSRAQFIRLLIRNIFKRKKKGFFKTFGIPILLGFISFFIIVISLAMGVNSYWLNGLEYLGKPFHILPYLVPGLVASESLLPGFSHFQRDVYTGYLVYPLIFLSVVIFKQTLKTLFIKTERQDFISNIKHLKNTKKNYMNTCESSPGKVYLKGLTAAFVIGFFIKNPITMLALSYFFMFSYIKNLKSSAVSLMVFWKLAKQLKKGKTDYLSVGKSVLYVRGLAYGFFFYFLLSLIIWFVLNYYIIARISLTLFFVIFFMVLRFQRKSQAQMLSLVFLIFLVSLTLTAYSVFGDDGGWIESGGNFFAWLGNAGSKIMALLGFVGGLASGIGWIADTIIGGLVNAICPIPILSIGPLLAGFSKPRGSKEATMAFTKAALNSAFAPLGSFGNTLGDMVGGIDGALNGETGGTSGGNSDGSGGSNGSDGTSQGGNGDYGGTSDPGGSNSANSTRRNSFSDWWDEHFG